MKNKTIFFNKWLSTRCLDAHLAKSLLVNSNQTHSTAKINMDASLQVLIMSL